MKNYIQILSAAKYNYNVYINTLQIQNKLDKVYF